MPKCISPPELSNAALLSVLDDLADPEVKLHLEGCEYCSQKLRNLESGLHNFTRRVYRSSCPTPMELTAYHLGELRKDRTAQIREHLELCAACRQEIAQFNEFMTATAPNEPKSNTKLNAVDILIASLQNLGGSLALAGVRGVGNDASRVIKIGEMQVSITTEEMDRLQGRFKLTGLLLGTEGFEWTAHLWNFEQHLGSNILIDGEFSFDNVEEGTYTLILENAEKEIHLQDLRV